MTDKTDTQSDAERARAWWNGHWTSTDGVAIATLEREFAAVRAEAAVAERELKWPNGHVVVAEVNLTAQFRRIAELEAALHEINRLTGESSHNWGRMQQLSFSALSGSTAALDAMLERAVREWLHRAAEYAKDQVDFAAIVKRAQECG